MVEPAVESESDTPSTSRLVIRVKLVPQEPRQPSVAQRFGKTALLPVLGAVAVLLGWLGISTFRATPTFPSAATETASNASSADSPTVSNEPPLKPAMETTVANSAEAISVESQVRQPSDAPPSSINEVLPDVPRSALETIRGTIRVSVRVNIDNHGAVIGAVADDRGPSRYFERLAVEAAKQWTFTPAKSNEPRTMLVQFNFTRAGTTAQASATR